MSSLRTGTARRCTGRRLVTLGIAAATVVAVSGAAGGVGSASAPPTSDAAANGVRRFGVG